MFWFAVLLAKRQSGVYNAHVFGERFPIVTHVSGGVCVTAFLKGKVLAFLDFLLLIFDSRKKVWGFVHLDSLVVVLIGYQAV